MAAVIGIVRAHNGLIKIESELGVGSTFRVLFPARGLLEGRSADKKADSAGVDQPLRHTH